MQVRVVGLVGRECERRAVELAERGVQLEAGHGTRPLLALGVAEPDGMRHADARASQRHLPPVEVDDPAVVDPARRDARPVPFDHDDDPASNPRRSGCRATKRWKSSPDQRRPDAMAASKRRDWTVAST